jgi:hypothetical protein
VISELTKGNRVVAAAAAAAAEACASGLRIDVCIVDACGSFSCDLGMILSAMRWKQEDGY